MRGRRLAWGSACAVVLAAIGAALINELRAGWLWWIAAGVAVLAGAALAGWLAALGGVAEGDRLDAGAVKAGRDIRAAVRTRVRGSSPAEAWVESAGDVLGPGAVKADRDIRGEVSTDVGPTGRSQT